MSALTTTFKELREWDFCKPRYRKLAKSLGGIRAYGRNTPIKLSQILDICGINDCFWALKRATLNQDYERELRLLACDYSERALQVFESRYPNDHRPRQAFEAARRYARNEIGSRELADAAFAARAAAFYASVLGAPRAVVKPVWAVVWSAVWAASDAVSWVTRTARDVERTAQAQMLRDVLVKLETGGAL